MLPPQLRFPPFRLDIAHNRLWREEHPIPLRAKAMMVLRLLVEQHGRVVTKEELLRTVWEGTVVSNNVLKVCINEIRQALGDEAAKPRFIETLPRQGYRFIAPLAIAQPLVASGKEEARDWRLETSPTSPQQASNLKLLVSPLVGREAELVQLTDCWQRARNGDRQIVFVTGEPGIGKTALVDAFRQRLETGGWRLAPAPQTSSLKSLASSAWFARGQCIEQYGAGEAYLPVLEALEQLAHTPTHEHITALLHQYAPLWLAQMPALLSASERERLQRELQGVTQERMLRELTTFLEALTADVPLIIVLEDLHWSDAATLTLLAAVARRRQAARILVIGTYRPTDAPDRQPFLLGLVHELRLHHLCQEIALPLLPKDAVATYIQERFAGQALPVGLTNAIYQQTDGNPLFMVNLVDQMLSQPVTLPQIDSLATLKPALGHLPVSLQQMLTYQIERLTTAERHLLETASVAGIEFSAATVAAALDIDALAVEQSCDDLVQRHAFLHRLPVTPMDLASTRNTYAFRHALLHDVFYERVGVLRGQQLHQRIGEWKEQVSRASGIDMSVELAAHFMASGDVHRSVVYLQQAARTALRRSAHPEARTHLAYALEWLTRLPDDETRTTRELELQLMLGVTLMNAQGSSSPQVEHTYARAYQLCQQLGSSPQLFPALWGLRTFYLVRSKYHTARDISAQLLQIAEATQSSDLLVEGHLALGATLMFQGEVHEGLQHLEACIQDYNPQQHRHHAYVYGQDPAVIALCHVAPFLVSRGYLDQAVTRIHQARTTAEEIGHLFSLGYTHCFTASVYAGRREAQLTLAEAERGITLAQARGFPHLQIMGTLLAGWARAVLGRPGEGVTQLQQALAAQQRIGYEIGRSFYLALLAELLCQLGQWEYGLAIVAEGMARIHTNGEWFHAAELYRIKGELLLTQEIKNQKSEKPNPNSQISDPESEAEGCFLKAIDIAQQQVTKLFELRATMALCRLWQRQGKKKQARGRLVEVYNWFTEGLALPDMQNATTLLAELR